MKCLYLLTLLFLFTACNNNDSGNKKENKPNTDIFGNTLTNNKAHGYLLDSSDFFINQIIHQHLQHSLNIQEIEAYSFEIYEDYVNKDSIKDAVIAINLLPLAKKESQKPNNTRVSPQLGYMGPYNAFFYFDGKSNTLSTPITVFSSAVSPLKVSFENISAMNFKDIIIDFRIRNSSFKEIYFISKNFPKRVFQWKNYDGLGTSNTEAYCFEYVTNENSKAKNIRISEGVIEQISSQADLFTNDPELINTHKQVKEFFYLEPEGKYFTQKEN